MKKYRLVSLLLILVFVITGCGSTADIEFDKYGNALVTYRYYMEEKEYNAYFVNSDSIVSTFDGHGITKDTPYEKTESRNGKLYYVYKFDYKEPLGNGKTYLDIGRDGVIATQELSTNGCLIDTSWKSLSYKKYKKDVFADLTITFKEKIISSNGVITNKGYTVSWTREDMLNCDFLYAYSDSYLKSHAPFTFELKPSGILRTDDEDKVKYLYIYSIIPFKHIWRGTKDILKYGTTKYKDGVYWFSYEYPLGKNTIDAENKVGTTRFKFTLDNTNPKVKGVKEGGVYRKVTIRYSDTGTGIRSAALNGVKVKNGATITRPGRYTLVVKDKAMHETVINFRIIK